MDFKGVTEERIKRAGRQASKKVNPTGRSKPLLLQKKRKKRGKQKAPIGKNLVINVWGSSKTRPLNQWHAKGVRKDGGFNLSFTVNG